MSVFNRGERVRITDEEIRSDKIYIIKDMKKVRDGGTLYLLRSLEENPVLRLYYEENDFLLERMS
jgi:hypothetical protein